MDFPVWFVDYITAPILIPLVAIPHVITAQFAVGGGIILADLVQRAYRNDRPDVLDFMRSVARYFVLITIVFGAVTGVGIWWTIGLTSPAATGTLVRLFAFFWAAEWMMFLIEIAAAFVFYYYWDELSPGSHVAVGWTYALAGWLSLVLITGITSFMLTSGEWTPGTSAWTAFLNPSFLPQTLIRTGGSLAIAALGVGVFISFEEANFELKDTVVREISKWALAGMLLIVIGGVWYFFVLPARVQLNLVRAPVLLVMTGLNFGVTILILGALGSGYVNGSRWITPPAAFMLFAAGMLAIGSGEFLREGSRKPYLIQDYMYSPGVHVSEVQTIRREGFVEHSPWLKEHLSRSVEGFGERPLRDLPEAARRHVGKALFRYHCGSCHATVGYNGIRPIVRPWTEEMIHETARRLHRANPAMPPWFGSEAEREMLAEYLETFTEPSPVRKRFESP